MISSIKGLDQTFWRLILRLVDLSILQIVVDLLVSLLYNY